VLCCVGTAGAALYDHNPPRSVSAVVPRVTSARFSAAEKEFARRSQELSAECEKKVQRAQSECQEKLSVCIPLHVCTIVACW
jgi:hypothetical protein